MYYTKNVYDDIIRG